VRGSRTAELPELPLTRIMRIGTTGVNASSAGPLKHSLPRSDLGSATSKTLGTVDGEERCAGAWIPTCHPEQGFWGRGWGAPVRRRRELDPERSDPL
jgi:hypothetical protein